ncbi:hypothetical protein DS62_01290 [Smithella sp. SC_K08D17]|jgi:hypothetical protein|nr:hypothetical protein KD27_01930 [Smithella sp. D17]KIE17691.1 hypothetical protein DS62_01290 [Smithella sp. SC_K08D17]MDD5523534.1 hypothetical protein [Kiritimatiellia bacterium]
MKKWKLWTGSILIFLAGVSIGAAGTGLYVRHRVMTVLQGGTPAVATLFTTMLARRLDLSDPQEKAVSKTVTETQGRLRELRRQYQPEARKIISIGIAQIKTELSPQQQKKLDEMYARFNERWKVQEIRQENLGENLGTREKIWEENLGTPY